MARKKPHDEHVDESWLIPYADLMTLLLALFIVLFAASNVDAAKFQAMSEFFGMEFSGTLPDLGNSVVEFPIAKPGQPTPTPTPTPTPPPSPGLGLPDPELQALYDSLTKYVEVNALTGNMALSLSTDGVLITLASDIWFASGSADLTPKMREFATELSNLLVNEQTGKQPLYVVITGHTDNISAQGTAFKTNWRLSASRALNFMELMLENSGFDERYFSARGYGEISPIADNATPEGRQRYQHFHPAEVIEKAGTPTGVPLLRFIVHDKLPLKQTAGKPCLYKGEFLLRQSTTAIQGNFMRRQLAHSS